MKKAILATKVGMTQIFNEDGVLTPVTVLQAGPCVVTQIKTVEKDVYKRQTVDIQLSHALNNVTSDLVVDDTKVNHCFDDVYEFEYETPLNFTHTYITLSNPQNDGQPGAFWPAIAEVEIWTEASSEESDLTNVAPQAAITSVGGDAGVKSNLVDDKMCIRDSSMSSKYSERLRT